MTTRKNDTDKPRRPKRSDGRSRAAAPDWVLLNYNAETTNAPNLEVELQRLQVLRTILPLTTTTTKADNADDSLTVYDTFAREAAELLQATTGRVTLVDLGRTVEIGSYTSSSEEQQQQLVDTIPPATTNITPRRQSFCAHTILSKTGSLIVHDAMTDDRFATCPDVTNNNIRFYAGVPLAIDGANVGVVSVVDTKPLHNDSDNNRFLLEKLTELQNTVARRIVQHWIDLRQTSLPTVPPIPCKTESLTPSSSGPESISLNNLVLSQANAPSSRSDNGNDPHRRSPPPLPSVAFSRSNENESIHQRTIPPSPKVQTLTHRAGTKAHLDLYGSDDIPITNFVRGLELVAQVAAKQVDVIFRVCQKLLEHEQHVSDKLKMGGTDATPLRLSHEALLFRAVATVLTSACARTSSGYVAITIQTTHSNPTTTDLPCDEQVTCLEIECEDTAGNVLSPDVFESNANRASSSFSDLCGLPTATRGNHWESDSVCCITNNRECVQLPDNLNPFNSCGLPSTAVVPDLNVVPRYMKVMHGEYGIKPRTQRYDSDSQNGSVVWMRVPFLS